MKNLYTVAMRDGIGIETTVLQQASYDVMRAASEAIQAAGHQAVVRAENGLKFYPKLKAA